MWEIWERHETALSSVINNWAPWIDRPMIGFYIEVISYRSNLSFCRNTTADRPWKSFSTQTHLRSVLIERMNYQKCESLKIVVYNWKPNSFLIIGMLQWHSIIRGDQQLPGESGLIIHSARMYTAPQQRILESENAGSFSSPLPVVTRLSSTYSLSSRNKVNISLSRLFHWLSLMECF